MKFFTKNPNLRMLFLFFFFLGGGGGGGRDGVWGGKSKWIFFTKNPNLKYKKKLGWGVGGRG